MTQSDPRPTDPPRERISDEVLETSRLVVELLQAAYAARHATPGLSAPDASAPAAGPAATGLQGMAAAPHGMPAGRNLGAEAAWDGGMGWDADRAEAGAEDAAGASTQMGAHAARVAMHVYRHGTRTIGELASGLGISYGWASRVVERLDAAGIVVRERDTTDRRVVHVSLAPSAIGEVERAYRWHGDAVAEALEPLSEQERVAVRVFLERLAAGLTAGAAARS